MPTTLENAVARARALAKAPGINRMPWPNLHVTRIDGKTHPLSCMSIPGIALILQGRKTTVLARETFTYRCGQVLAGSLSVPDTYQIVEASPSEPFLSVTLRLNRALVAEVARELPDDGRPEGALSFQLYDAEEALVDAYLRLMRAMDSPTEAQFVAPLVEREILYRVMTGPAASVLRGLTRANTPEHRVRQAISWLSEHYREPLAVDALADRVHLGVSSFYRHFKDITSLSPLQYHKMLRLNEAQRLMTEDGCDAAAAAYRVGYASPTQFSREYKRFFGLPPRRHTLAAQPEG